MRGMRGISGWTAPPPRVAVVPESWWKSPPVEPDIPAQLRWTSDGHGLGDLRRAVESRLDPPGPGLGVTWSGCRRVYPSPLGRRAGYGHSATPGHQTRTFGTWDEFDRLLGRACTSGGHAAGHGPRGTNTSGRATHVFVEVRSSRTNPERDWYWWAARRPLRPPRPGGAPGGRADQKLGVVLLRGRPGS